MPYETILTDLSDGVFTLTFNRPDVLNAFNDQMAREVQDALKQAERDAELKAIVGEKGQIAWGSQIRSYVLDDRRVKDHRTNFETHDVESVLDRGELDQFIDAELRRRKAARNK